MNCDQKNKNAASENFSWKELFSQVFGKHSAEDMEHHWAAGTIGNIPTIDNVSTACPQPWAFIRVLGLSLLSYIILLSILNYFGQPIVLPALVFIGTMAVPFSILVFFFEMNVRRNVSMHLVMRIFILGGALSLLFTMLAHVVTDNILKLGWLGASVAGITEETAKLIAVLVAARGLRYPYILNGMLFGAAIGAGFAAFESAGYAFGALEQGGIEGLLGSITMRGALAPFCHVIWTAITAGALWGVKGSRKLTASMLYNFSFLKFFVASVVLHMIWNSPWPAQLHLLTPFDLLIVLGIIGWVIVIQLLRAGLNQLKQEQMAYCKLPETEPGIAKIIKTQAVYVEKLTEPNPDMQLLIFADKEAKPARAKLEVDEQINQSRKREEERQRPDFSDRAWKKYYQRDQNAE